MDADLEAIGTNAHELPMAYAALAKNDADLLASPYRVLRDWQRYYGGNLLVVLPDAFGTDAFLSRAPDWVSEWKGFRPDSAPPIEGALLLALDRIGVSVPEGRSAAWAGSPSSA